MAPVDHTPLMKQYYDIKDEHPDALLLFQVGDFFELFFDDAKQAAETLGIALTARGKNKGEPIPLCGVPLHAKDHYVTKLVKAGFNVAVCEQLEPPQPGTIVKRGVTQVLTPGTLTDTKLLDEKSASYLFSFFPMHDSWGLVFGELLTAQLFATTVPADAQKALESELIRFFPDEIIVPAGKQGAPFTSFFKQRGYVTTAVPEELQQADTIRQADAWVGQQFKEKTQASLQSNQALHHAVVLLYAYLNKNQQAALAQFTSVQFYRAEDFLLLDPATQRNLELVKNLHDGSRRNTLFSVVDKAATAMGSRMVKKWLLRPLVKKEHIVQRQDAVAQFVRDTLFGQMIAHHLSRIGDIERIVGRIALNRGSLYDYVRLSGVLSIVPSVVGALEKKAQIPLFAIIIRSIEQFSQLQNLLQAALNDDTSKPWTIKPGFDKKLDQLRDLVEHAQQKIIALEQREQERTGISSLKVRYNQAHGYYIEITKANLDHVPDTYQRKQTLVGKERFITPELRELQHDIMTARSEIDQVEAAVFEQVKQSVVPYMAALRKMAHALSNVDALLSFGLVSSAHGYVRPEFAHERMLEIADGRHPVVEQAHARGHSFIPNDTALGAHESTWIITGPNMGGKSTYLRQVALIAIMAQCGCFVPARSVRMALLDRIFTRIGAGDNVSEGKSTFLVEMEETAQICNQATRDSLVILDEVGRGTSTFDGLAIAQAVLEYLHGNTQPYCLFATHYHELTQLQKQLPGVVSYYAASKKTHSGILFLYKMTRGVADGSFGVEVAKLAQLPQAVIRRSEQVLAILAESEARHSSAMHEAVASAQGTKTRPVSDATYKHVGDEQVHQELETLRKQNVALQEKLAARQQQLELLQVIDYDELSPKKAFDILWQMKENAGLESL